MSPAWTQRGDRLIQSLFHLGEFCRIAGQRDGLAAGTALSAAAASQTWTNAPVDNTWTNVGNCDVDRLECHNSEHYGDPGDSNNRARCDAAVCSERPVQRRLDARHHIGLYLDLVNPDRGGCESKRSCIQRNSRPDKHQRDIQGHQWIDSPERQLTSMLCALPGSRGKTERAHSNWSEPFLLFRNK